MTDRSVGANEPLRERLGARLRRWLRRGLREWFWVVRRRIQPRRFCEFAFDGDLRIGLYLQDELALRYALGQHFEPDVCEFFRNVLKPGLVVFDVGANVGQFTLLAAKRVGTAGNVHAFEPAPEEYRKLSANVSLNGFSNVLLNHVAICDRVGETVLRTAGPGLGLYNSLGKPLVSSQIGDISVPCTTLDCYVQARGVPRVDLLKVDVEGAELGVLRGAAHLLSPSDAPVIVCEFSDLTGTDMGHSTRELRRCLEAFAYRHIYQYSLEGRCLVPEPARERYEYANLVCSKYDLTTSR